MRSTLNSIQELQNLDQTRIAMVLVYDTTCQHSRAMYPGWQELVNKYNHQTIHSKQIQMYQLGEDQSELRQSIIQTYKVMAYPSILIFKKPKQSLLCFEYTDWMDVDHLYSFIENGCVI